MRAPVAIQEANFKNLPQTARTELITDSFYDILPHFQLGTKKESQMCTLTPSHRSPQFWWARLKPRQASSLQSGQPGSPPVFLWEAVLSSACFSGSAKPKRWSLPLLLSQAQNQHPVFPMWSVFVYLQKNTLKGLSYVWGGSYKALWRESKRTSWVGPRVKSAVTLAMTVSVWVPVCVPRPEAASEGNPNHLSSRSSNTGSSA